MQDFGACIQSAQASNLVLSKAPSEMGLIKGKDPNLPNLALVTQFKIMQFLSTMSSWRKYTSGEEMPALPTRQ